MSELVCESPLRVSTSNLSYPMFAVNWPRGHVNTRVNKSMTNVSVIEDISDIVSISRGFMEYPPLPFTCYDIIAWIRYPRTPNLFQSLCPFLYTATCVFQNIKIILKQSSMSHLRACLDVSIGFIVVLYRY